MTERVYNEVERRKLLEELERRQRQKDGHEAKYDATPDELRKADLLGQMLFAQQQEFFNSPALRKCGFCSRRAGKTIGSAIHLLRTLVRNPRTLCLYVAQTQQVARMYMWKEIRELTDRFELPLEFHENNLWVKHKRAGGIITLRGADKFEQEAAKLRGPKWKLAIIDECGTYGPVLEQFVIETISPALRDENGELILIGTAGRQRAGLFFQACHELLRRPDGSPVYELHKWSLQDNPHLSPQAKDLDLICIEDGLSKHDPKFLREYLMTWAAGDSERVWSGYDPERNDVDVEVGVDALPKGHTWEFLLGLDFGWQDESGIAVLAFSRSCKKIYCMETWAKNHAFADEIAQKVFDYRAKYNARRCVGDVGGQGKIFQQQLLRDYQIHVEPAKKQEKLVYIEFMNSALLRGDLLIQKGDGVCREMEEVVWDENRKNIANHAKDNRVHSLLYGWRAAHYLAGRKAVASAEAARLANSPNRGTIEKLAVLNAKPIPKAAWWEQTYDSKSNRAGPFDSAVQRAGRRFT